MDLLGRARPVGMSRQEIEALASELATNIAEPYGLEVVDAEYVKEQGGFVLRVFIDKDGGVTLDDCQMVSEVLSDRLDEIDPIPGSYSLEVSSPGLDRPLKKPSDYERFAGRQVKLKTYAPIDGRKNWKGALIGLEGDAVRVEVDGEEFVVPLKMIARANLVPEF